MSEACPFCSIDSSRIVFRDEFVFAVFDGFPISDGHLLLITQRHVPEWFDASAVEQHALIAAITKGRQLVLERFAPHGFNIGINVGLAAGQTVPHLHVHLIPRYTGDVPDPRGGVRHVIPGKANYLLASPSAESLLVTGAEDPLLPHLRSCFDRASRADLCVAFILRSGVEIVREHLRDLLERGGQVRVVTGDYLDLTDPDALVELLDLDGDLQLRVFEAGTTSFHPKSYLFHNPDGSGTAFVGSSNLSQSALSSGIEWNYRVLRSDHDRGFADVVRAFEDLFAHPRTRSVDDAWIAAYRRRRPVQSLTRVVEVIEEPPAPIPEPHAIQREALAALAATREAGNEAGLVVLATGLGKTWLAAFDSARGEFRRVLFVAHREEILTQAMQTFRRIRPLARLGRYTGQEKSPAADVLFASIQTLGRVQHLDRFSPDAFDYVVVDEFHHAAARTYRQLIDYFSPRFLLGLTATPERMDGGDLLALCQENLVYRKGVVAGIESGLLCPFRYFGVPDDVDYSNIPWRSNRFDEEELTKAVATNRRAQNALEEFRKCAAKRALGFCCSQRHADFMADYFNGAGVRARSVHAGATSAPRASALEALADGQIDIIFAVDMFNEGLDIPTIDTVLMLRPTESTIIWMQQFGRGLRKVAGKVLNVVDYIGNHRSFLVKVRSLLQPIIGEIKTDAEISAALRLLLQGRMNLPPGCAVTYDLEAIDIIQSLLRTRAADDAILAFYEDFRERHGVRPTAVELYHSGYNPRSLRRTHGSWVRFVRTMGDVSPSEQRAVESAGDFLEELEKTPMTKSFKMVTLQAMLNRDALPGNITIDDLTQEFRRVAGRSETLRADVGPALDRDSELQQLIEKNPVDAWSGGKGTGNRAFFSWDGANFGSDVGNEIAEIRQDFQNLVRELVDWRLAEYLDRRHDAEAGRFICRVLQSQGRPILKLPDREKAPGVPAGWVNVSINDAPYVANFAQEFLNVVRGTADSEENLLPEILRGWFGADAGQPGTRFQVAVEPAGDAFKIQPAGGLPATSSAENWRHYLREDIPPLFGLKFNTGSWNQGFVVSGQNVFLLVTIEKGGLQKGHRYDDRFLSPELFQWQSQNHTTRESTHGHLLRDHRTTGTHVHLFVRKNKLVDGKAAPFVYCGEADFEKWHGDAPVTVEWRLREPVPAPLWRALDIPETSR